MRSFAVIDFLQVIILTYMYRTKTKIQKDQAQHLYILLIKHHALVFVMFGTFEM